MISKVYNYLYRLLNFGVNTNLNRFKSQGG